MLMTLQLPTSGVPTLENEGNSQAPRSDKQTKSSINPDLTCVPNGLELDVKFSLEFPAPILSRRPGRISKRLRVYGTKQQNVQSGFMYQFPPW